ncbi:squalene/phytoene synthase family protein [Aquabacter sp. L1I39]|uniref:phytoene/squalene synthase family protein n=1 Tax=Aquabacter sp. L1I39 TaxID=2820278 RepID=UPI001ADC6D83|nr:phytoene/squalene synthase family protein [Aquabacter sp. L1I39]QTL02444.1 squalene/phytoene synthase family protein [Aquabacter sp. L1I39]
MAEPEAPQAAPTHDAAYAHCGEMLRAQDRDRFLATLFAPEAERRHLWALYAFSQEIARVREVVREALPGEMRLQWWREVIEGLGRGDVSGHPVALAICATLEAKSLPRGALLNLIDARTFDLYDDPMPTLNDLEGYAGETASILIQLGAQILTGRAQPAVAEAAGHAGVAIALTGLMRAFPFHAARGQCYLPLDMLRAQGIGREEAVGGIPSPALAKVFSELRAVAAGHVRAAVQGLGDVPRDALPVFLPLALVPGDLKALARVSDPFKTVAGTPPFLRLWTIWRAARRARAGRPLVKPPAA